MIFTSQSFAIGRAHFQVAGGVRTFALVLLGYAALAAAILGAIFYSVPEGSAPLVAGALITPAMVIEAIILVVFGCLRAALSTRSDVISNMIESHRLMPVSAWRATLGYLFGSNAHVLGVTALNVILLFGLRWYSGRLPLDDLMLCQVVLMVFSLFAWSFATLGALMIRQVIPLMLLGFVFGTLGSFGLQELGILPGLSMLTGPLLGETIFGVLRFGLRSFNAYPVSSLGELMFATLFFIGACRRYRGTFPATYNVPLALAFGAAWAFVSVPSIIHWREYVVFAHPIQSPVNIPDQLVATLLVAALFAIIPMVTLIASQKRRDWPPALVAAVIAATVLIALLNVIPYAWYHPASINPHFSHLMYGKVLVTAAVFTAHVLTLYFIFRATRNMSTTAIGVSTVALLFAIWIGPFLAELVRFFMLPLNERPNSTMSVIATLSPLGQLVNTWLSEEPHSPGPGVFFQFLVAAGVWQLSRRLNRTKPPDNEALPPAIVTASSH